MTDASAERQHRAGRWFRVWHERPQAVVLALGMAVQAGLVLWFARNTWFTADAWYYISRRGLVARSDLGLLEPYAGHWQTIPILVFRGMFAAVGLQSYVPYLVLVLVLHLVICTLLYQLLRRLGISPNVSAMATWLVLFHGYGAEAFGSDGPLPLMLTLVFGLAALLLTLRTGPRTATSGGGASPVTVGWATTAGVAVLLLLGVMTSILGLVTLMWVVLVAVVLGPGWRWGMVVATPATVAFLMWFLGMGRHSDRIRIGDWAVLDVGHFIWTGLTTSLEATAALSPLGGVLLLVLVVVLVRVRDLPHAARGAASIGLLAAMVQMWLIAAGTSPESGSAQAQQSRYSYVTLVLLTPAVALVLVVLARGFEKWFVSGAGDPRVGLLLTVVVLAAPTIVGVIREHQFIDVLSGRSNVMRVWIVGSLAGVADGQDILLPHPGSPDLQKLDLRLLTDPGIAVPLGHPSATAAQRLAAEMQFFTYVGPVDPGLPSPPTITTQGLRRIDSVGGPCGLYRAERPGEPVVLVLPGGSALRVTSASAAATTRLARGDELSWVRAWRLPAGPVFVGSTATGTELRVSFDGSGRYRICEP